MRKRCKLRLEKAPRIGSFAAMHTGEFSHATAESFVSDTLFTDLAEYSQPVLGVLSESLRVPMTLAQVNGPREEQIGAKQMFCTAFAGWNGESCGRFHRDLRRGSPPAGSLRQCRCPAGFVHLAAPLAGPTGAEFATLEAGRFFGEPPELSVFTRITRQANVPNSKIEPLRRHYFQQPVLDDRQLATVRHVLRFATEGLSRHIAERQSSLQTAITPLARAKQYIRQNLNRPLTRREVAAAAGVHEDHLTRLFRREGLGFVEHINRERIKQAERLLEKDRLRISEIAYACGYESIPHFNRQFRKITGMSPTVYRNTVRG